MPKALADVHGFISSAVGCALAALVTFAASALSAADLHDEAIELAAVLVLFCLLMIFGAWWYRR